MANKDKYILNDKAGATIVMDLFGLWEKEIKAVASCKKFLNKTDLKFYNEFIKLIKEMTRTNDKYSFYGDTDELENYKGRGYYRIGPDNPKYSLSGYANSNYYNDDYLYYMIAPCELSKEKEAQNEGANNEISGEKAHENLMRLKKLEVAAKGLFKAIHSKTKKIKTDYDQWYVGIKSIHKERKKCDYNSSVEQRWAYEIDKKLEGYLEKHPMPKLTSLDLVRAIDCERTFNFNKELTKLLDYSEWAVKHKDIKEQLYDTDCYAVAYKIPNTDQKKLAYLGEGDIGDLQNAKIFPNIAAAEAEIKKQVWLADHWMIVKFEIIAKEIIKGKMNNTVLHSIIDGEGIDKVIGGRQHNNKKLKI